MNIFNSLKAIAGAAALTMGVIGTANAAIVTSKHDPFIDRLITTSFPYTYTHDLRQYGLPGAQINSASIEIGLWDATDLVLKFPETVTLNFNGNDSRTIKNVSFSGQEYSFDLLTSLLTTGLLEVTISVGRTCGFLGCVPQDVMFDYSTLTADITPTAVDVPEPATLFTLGAGLLGLAASRRRAARKGAVGAA